MNGQPMMRRIQYPIVVFLFPLFLSQQQLTAQESTIYASVLSTKLFVVGAANANTGLYYQHPSEDSTWHHTGATRIRAFGLATDGSSKGKTLYIASGDGVHKTTDGGATWRITTGWEITEVQCVTPDPGNKDVVYATTPYGVHKTIDGCVTWKLMNNGLQFPFFAQSIIIDHSDPKTLFCAMEQGVYVSHDGAANWRRTGLHVANTRVIVQHPNDPKTLFVGTENNGLYVTRNGGAWWTKTEAGIDHATFYAIAFDPNHPDTMYAGGYVTGMYKSVDGGASWKRKSNGMEYLTIRSIAVDPKKSNRVYAGTIFNGIHRTEDGGESWKSAGLRSAQVYRVVIQPN